MTPTLHIRPATLLDAPAIYRFVCALEEEEFDRALFDAVYQRNLANPDNIYRIAELEGRPLGYISAHGQSLLHHLGMVYEVQELFVEDGHRSLGIGARLLHELEGLLRQRPCLQIEVTSRHRRADAHRFYEREGYQHTHKKFTKMVAG